MVKYRAVVLRMMSDVTRCHLLPMLPSLGRLEYLPMFAETVTFRYYDRHRSQSNWKQIDWFVAVQCKAWSASAGIMGSSPAGGMDVSCVVSRGLCVRLITRAEES